MISFLFILLCKIRYAKKKIENGAELRYLQLLRAYIYIAYIPIDICGIRTRLLIAFAIVICYNNRRQLNKSLELELYKKALAWIYFFAFLGKFRTG